MAPEGHSTAVYLRDNINEKLEQMVLEFPKVYKSKSQLINSVLYKFLMERGRIPKEENQA